MTSKEDVELAYREYQYNKGRFDKALHEYYMERPKMMLCATSEIDLYDCSAYMSGFNGEE